MTMWYVLKGKNKFGPFSYKEVIRLRQSHQLQDYDFVWTTGMHQWTKLAEVRDFCPERVQEVLDHTDSNPEVFKKRVNKRIELALPLWAHNHLHLWPGKTKTISIAGAGVELANPTLLPGDKLLLHFRRDEIVQPFNVKAEIISKNYSRETNKMDSVLKYNLKFTDIPSAGEEQLKEWITV